MSVLSTLQNNNIKDHLKTTFYDNSPNLIIMDFGGRCWGLDEKRFDNFYHSENNRIYYDETNNSYYREDNSDYRKFGGWNMGTDDCLWSACSINCGLTGLLDINNYRGYNSTKSPNECPSRNADSNNYYKQDDKDKFDKNRNNRIFSWTTGSDPPNAIPGYYRISRNNDKNDNVNPQTWIIKNKDGIDLEFPEAGFVTLQRSDVEYDLAFILFVKYIDRNHFVDDIIKNHSTLVNNILNEKYNKNGLSKCMKLNTNLNSDNDWIHNFEESEESTVSTLSTLQHSKSNYCLKFPPPEMDAVNDKIKKLACSNTIPEFKWRRTGDMITKGTGEVKCMDSNGTSIYLNKCDPDNSYQKWSFEGRKIIHNKSGKCLTVVDGDSNAKLVDCSCKYDLDRNTDDFRTKYIDLVKQKYNNCKNKENLNYNNIDDCNDLLIYNDTMSMKFVNWCVDNDSNVQATDYCIDALQANKYLDIYNSKECSKQNNIMNNKYCSSFLKKKLDDKERELYNKITYDTILNKWCSDTNKFISGNENWKYTDKPYDKDCLNNWNYYSRDGVNIIESNIPNITSLNNTKTWCATRSNSDDNAKCNYLNSRNNYINKDNYNELNTYWKQTGCLSELPIPLFLKVMNMEIDEQKTYLKTNFLNNPNFYTRNICYTGDTIENNTIILPNQCIYSQNKNYKLCLTEKGELHIYDIPNNTSRKINTGSDNTMSSELAMQTDGNLVLYNKDGTYWSSSTFTKNTFGVMRNDGQFVLYSKDGNIVKTLSPKDEEFVKTLYSKYVPSVLYKTFFSSSFDNKDCLEDTENNKEYNYDNNILFILFIILFTLIIILLKFKNKCKNTIFIKTDYDNKKF